MRWEGRLGVLAAWSARLWRVQVLRYKHLRGLLLRLVSRDLRSLGTMLRLELRPLIMSALVNRDWLAKMPAFCPEYFIFRSHSRIAPRGPIAHRASPVVVVLLLRLLWQLQLSAHECGSMIASSCRQHRSLRPSLAAFGRHGVGRHGACTIGGRPRGGPADLARVTRPSCVLAMKAVPSRSDAAMRLPGHKNCVRMQRRGGCTRVSHRSHHVMP